MPLLASGATQWTGLSGFAAPGPPPAHLGSESAGCLPPRRPGPPGPEATGRRGSLLPQRTPHKPLLLLRLLPTQGLESQRRLLRLYFTWRKFWNSNGWLSSVSDACVAWMGAPPRGCVDFRAADGPSTGIWDQPPTGAQPALALGVSIRAQSPPERAPTSRLLSHALGSVPAVPQGQGASMLRPGRLFGNHWGLGGRGPGARLGPPISPSSSLPPISSWFFE